MTDTYHRFLRPGEAPPALPRAARIVQYPERRWEHLSKDQQKAISERNKRISRLQRKTGAYPPDIGWGILMDLLYMEYSLELPLLADDWATEERIQRIEQAYAALDPKEQRRRARIRPPVFF